MANLIEALSNHLRIPEADSSSEYKAVSFRQSPRGEVSLVARLAIRITTSSVTGAKRRIDSDTPACPNRYEFGKDLIGMDG